MDDNTLESEVLSQSIPRPDFNLQEKSHGEESGPEVLDTSDDSLEEEPNVGMEFDSEGKSDIREARDEMSVPSDDDKLDKGPKVGIEFASEEKSRIEEVEHDVLVKVDDKLDEEPKDGMEFDSEESAYEFYNSYAEKIGFSVRKAWVSRSEGGIITKRTFCCYKEGRKREDRRGEQVKYTRPATRTQCLAQMTIRLQKNGKYSVSKFVAEHNHEVIAPSKARLLRSHRAKDVMSMRYNYLCRKFIKIATIAAESEEAFNVADKLIDELDDKLIEIMKRVKEPQVLRSQTIDETVATETEHQPTNKEVTCGDSMSSQLMSKFKVTAKVGSSCAFNIPLDKARKKRFEAELKQRQKSRKRNGLSQAPLLIKPPSFQPSHYPIAVAPLSYFTQGPVTIVSPFALPGGFYAGVDHQLVQLHQNSSKGSVMVSKSSSLPSDDNQSQCEDHRMPEHSSN